MSAVVSIAPGWSNRFVDAQIPHVREDRGWRGTHCYGLVRLVFREDLGLDLADYGPALMRDRMRIPDGARLWPWVSVSNAVSNPLERRPYDVVVFDRGGFDDHCGVVVDARDMLHLARANGVAMVDPIEPGWGALSGVYRHEALA